MEQAAHDHRRRKDVRDSVRPAGVLLALLVLVDWGSGRLAPWRCALWFALALLLFLVLYPARVSAGEDWLASRRLLRERRVRTDLLVSVRFLDGVAQRLVLKDALGGRVEIDPEVLLREPELWRRLDEGARRAADDGLLLCGATALRRLARRVDSETAQAVFKASGLD
ncbi:MULTISPECIES: hypothetical protein [unclassified Streptomyces]|uniref:hypothetical protein n=1 Tax=unclassified Streptomyces TaxID=2593676 RepID=UPI00119ECB8C|nr:hypothetical protein [Streptomyces sp. BK340]TVZ77759.1 hypothetical protein FB157_13765 [Streptomyces sp. BK340]